MTTIKNKNAPYHEFENINTLMDFDTENIFQRTKETNKTDLSRSIHLSCQRRHTINNRNNKTAATSKGANEHESISSDKSESKVSIIVNPISLDSRNQIDDGIQSL